MQPKSREAGGDKGAWKTVIRPTNSSGPALLPALPFPFARHLPVSLPDHPLPPVDYALRARVPRREPAAARRHHHLPQRTTSTPRPGAL